MKLSKKCSSFNKSFASLSRVSISCLAMKCATLLFTDASAYSVKSYPYTNRIDSSRSLNSLVLKFIFQFNNIGSTLIFVDTVLKTAFLFYNKIHGNTTIYSIHVLLRVYWYNQTRIKDKSWSTFTGFEM